MLANENIFTRRKNMKKMIRNVGAVLSVGGIGVYTVYKMVFGRTKKTDEMEMIQGKQYEP
jgi:hypothetical protein